MFAFFCLALLGGSWYFLFQKQSAEGVWWEAGDLPPLAHADDWEWDFATLDRILVQDMDGDGSPEILMNSFPSKSDRAPGKLLCYDEAGKLKWEYQYGRALSHGGRSFDPYYIGRSIRFVETPQRSYVLTTSLHHRWYPCQVSLLDPDTGELIEEYWHPGGFSHCLIHDLDSDGTPEAILAGVNNPGDGLGRAAMAVLKLPFSTVDPKPSSDSPFSELTGNLEFKYVLFPRPDLSWVEGNVFQIFELERDAKEFLTVRILATNSGGNLFYKLDGALNLVEFGLSGDYIPTHDRLWISGILDHRFSTQERECLSSLKYFPTAPDGTDPQLFEFWRECEFAPGIGRADTSPGQH